MEGVWAKLSGGGPAAVASALAPPADPLLAFAGSAAPGASGTVATTDGLRLVRLVRSYHAASGRECREVALARPAGVEERRLACAIPDGWEWAAPLLASDAVTAGAVR